MSRNSTLWEVAPWVAMVKETDPLRYTLLNMNTSQPIILTETAAWIWQLTIEQIDIEEICRRLGNEYEIDKYQIDPQVRRFIENLVNHSYLIPEECSADAVGEPAPDEQIDHKISGSKTS